MIPRSKQGGDLDLLFDYAAMRLNGQKAEGKSMKLNWNFTDTNQQYILELENEALSHIAGRQARDADATVTLTRAKLNNVVVCPRRTNGPGLVFFIWAALCAAKAMHLRP
jgi:alkyl sulfatase BDS1-like metallo-beta-lactamase superfamily hydrolase